MTSKIEIVNMALTMLGESRILSIDDDVKPAREMKAVYDITLDKVLSSNTWSFSKARTQLIALSQAPAFGYSRQFQLPADCLRVIMVGDYYVGVDLTDYRGFPTEEFTIEGRKILTDMSAPLNLIYGQRVSDATQFSAPFVYAFAAKLAEVTAEPITQSTTKRDAALREYNTSISAAVRANAIELPPQKFADDEWLISRR